MTGCAWSIGLWKLSSLVKVKESKVDWGCGAGIKEMSLESQMVRGHSRRPTRKTNAGEELKQKGRQRGAG